ncbi:DUF5723 family protein [Muriicola sp. Z0-33]|uniref:DUF5723 family protein n=1 Tax=Muriicola sp. Z0-33 TaxID=2816957 RepID=UPI002238B271|nr:DUF5723 family protein [Muriicola sp. Z0-33]MCW5516772.1 hypothetical protein [Muriicola sp. Z0-33]
MKNIKIVLLTLLMGSASLYAQNKQVLYDFTEIPQALLLNPGMQTDYQWYAGLPALSGISIQAGSSGLTVHDIFADDGVDINEKIRQKAIFGMGITDELSGTHQIDLLNGGFRGKKRPSDFYSFGIYHEGDAIGYWFKDLAILAYQGNADQLGREFDLSHLKTRGEILNVFHFGVNRQMNNKLTLGARAKIYSGIIDFNSTSNDGHFVTNVGQNNLLANTIVADMQLRTSGIDAFRAALDDDAADEATEIRKLVTKRGFLGGDLGLGLDLGFSYNLNEQTVITASLLDLGFIYHSGATRNFTLNGSATVEGVEIILPDALSDPNADFWQELVDEIEALVPFEENNNAYITFRPTKLHSSIRYNFGEPKQSGAPCDCDYRTTGQKTSAIKYANSLGGQLYAINRPRGPQMALTAFYLRRFGRAMALKTTYTIDKFSRTNIGLGLNLQAGPVNFYLIADNLLAYQNIANAHYASFQIGLNIISWGKN